MKFDFGNKKDGNLVKFNKKQLNNYIETCREIWGCVPIDVNWAIRTKIYQQNSKEI